ncbi:unnamed protein product [Rotaria sp. Silwood2]|nr:unnamed protein product [Rotaria sp. Silwood2]CAF2957796.1 unnamed protein product [Rotaria sp. Silwood2]CAF3897084.1 unnamed protein product [Rotaria sp. Silwood2]CAF4088450.1 unnamed protein product [Rotaria sp. Silwood2]
MNTNNDNLNMMMAGIAIPDDGEADVLNDETFGDCDLEAIKIKSDFGENGEFLGDNPPGDLPAFFDTDVPDTGGISLVDDDNDDQSQQPSIDALLGEDPMRFSTTSIHRRPGPFIQQSSINPLFNMAISQAQENNRMNLFPQQQQSQHQQQQIRRISPMTLPQQQINYQLLKQFEQMLINKQVPPQERLIYIQAMMEKMQRDAMNAQQQQQQQIQQQQAARLMNLNINGHDRFHEANPNRVLNNPMLYAQRQQQQQQQREASMRSMAIGEMLERARLSATNTTNSNNSRSQSPSVGNTGISSQFMDAIQRSDQIPIIDNHQQHRTTESPSSPLDTIVSPSSSSRHSRQNRPAKHYPRPPLLNTWQGRGSGHDEFAGLMTDREKQWVVKIQLHQVSQTQEEDYYFHKWSQQKRHMQQVHGNQSNRHEHRGQYISYPVLQLLKSIQQEKELSQRLSQSSIQATFSNVNPAHALPYASPMPTQLGKQSTATPRHPKCILDLDGQFALGVRINAITHDKYTLGLLLNIENIHRDILRLDDDDETPITPSKTLSETNTSDGTTTTTTTPSSTILESIIDRYLNHPDYLFADMFAQFNKGQILLERLYPYLVTATSITNHLELMLIRLYGSLNYMIRCWPTTFHIEPIVMNMISLMQQQVNIKKTTFEQLLSHVYIYYDQKIKSKLLELNSTVSSSPFSDPVLFTNSHTVTILIELLLTLERRCYLLPGMNSSTLPVQLMQQLQPQLQYQLSEHVRLLVNDLCQALVSCSSPTYTPKKMLKPFAQVQQQQFTLLCKFLRIQIPQHIYAALESKLIFCCIKDI